MSERLGIAAAEVQSVYLGQFAIADRTEIHDLSAERFEPAQVVLVVEVEGVVEGDPQTAARRAT